MQVTPSFIFWILIALANTYVFHIVPKPHKYTFQLAVKFLKKLEYLGPDRRCTEHMCICAVTKGANLKKIQLRMHAYMYNT